MKIDEMARDLRSPVGPGILHQLETLIEQNRNYERQLTGARAALKSIRREFPETRATVNSALSALESPNLS